MASDFRGKKDAQYIFRNFTEYEDQRDFVL